MYYYQVPIRIMCSQVSCACSCLNFSIIEKWMENGS
uniref:Uncharacterized protein n=1 Tax=Rhizophora mucronata TaxID=61149 RepID=A0A2P2PVM0_RHIMU